ncbi:hypothetical protein DWB61_01695 [Ancylomarina euxinus]|uniref:Peptidase M10 metallopeptidase domain-containing protein n=1 Tax=Ancylomarina euxinus TaxID=2283627 RepID=A0A425Y870_9BACT|nr:hypothetical protein [Ancylomarina euxinus]MCZ4693377.1 hypothetical protein [Ancylomarina euxinus]MUP13605.1 hypothetical protein [Ancylomarina euxinus]RRG24749.1 hypothetical protein DWB61_01695 [Ancylomarina euxinus]
MKSKIALLLPYFLLTLISCENNSSDKQTPIEAEPIFMDLSSYYSQSNLKSTNGEGVPENLRVLKAEYFTTGESGKIGRTVFFMNVGNKKLDADFVPHLDFSLDGTTDITYYIDENRPSSDLALSETTAAIQRAMATWDGVTCSNLNMTQLPYSGKPTGFIAALLGFGGSFNYFGDVTHCGWLPTSFFDLIDVDGGSYILGVTFTIIFTNSDYDNNKKADVAWREIYYNDGFSWRIGDHYDLETIALHESGHGLSQGHFGKAFLDAGTGKVHFSPRSVMNAAYSGIQTHIEKTDNAGHCSIWANWPN